MCKKRKKHHFWIKGTLKSVRKKGWDKNALRADMEGISLLEKGFCLGKRGIFGDIGDFEGSRTGSR
jgi:hypothetical protein